MRLCVFEDAGVANLEPLSLTRPVFDLWLGAGTLLSRLLRVLPAADVGAIVRPTLAKLCRRQHPEMAVNDIDWLRRGPVVFVNARWLPPILALEPAKSEIGMSGEHLAYAAVESADLEEASPEQLALRLKEVLSEGKARAAGGVLMSYLWDFVERNAEALGQDFLGYPKEKKKTPHHYNLVGRRDQVFVDPNATLEPQVLLDSTRGPVMIDRGAVVQAFSRLEGPCYVGQGTQILAARLRGGSIGPLCRIGGEVESSIVLGYTNKYHDGFLGHSYIGEWVNFGAGSHTSDLRTDYGSITMPINGVQVNTGLMKIGSYLGDHTSMSINTLLNTGTMAGPFALLLTSGTLLPRLLPPFCRYGHGRVEERTDLGQMFETSAIVMGRRGQEWTEAHAEFCFDLYERTAATRQRVLRENEQHRLRRVV